MTGSSDTAALMLQAERDLARAERQLGLAQTRAADLKAELTRTAATLTQERAQVAQLEAALHQVYTSTSWRLSRPVRLASRIIATARGRKLPSPVPPIAAPAGLPTQPALPAREAAILQRLQRRAL